MKSVFLVFESGLVCDTLDQLSMNLRDIASPSPKVFKDWEFLKTPGHNVIRSPSHTEPTWRMHLCRKAKKYRGTDR
jgi:hypothetical protein